MNDEKENKNDEKKTSPIALGLLADMEASLFEEVMNFIDINFIPPSMGVSVLIKVISHLSGEMLKISREMLKNDSEDLDSTFLFLKVNDNFLKLLAKITDEFIELKKNKKPKGDKDEI